MAGLDRHAKATLRRELTRVEEEIVHLQGVAKYLRDRIKEDEASAPEPAAKPVKARAASRSGGRVTAADAAARVLSNRGEPMRTPDLLPEVQKLGAKMSSVDNLYRTLVGNERFQRVGRGEWALREWPDTSQNGDGPG